ncbi:MAG: hypothetical protein J6S49_09515 [Erysipelotrichaceae bacterium]|nr:hypothetical protein [Erysipelotrichaceae bacterium]
MAIKIIREIKVNSFRVIFGKVDSQYLICLPDIECSGYLKSFTEENQQDNIMLLSEIFNRKGFKRVTLSYLVVKVITDYWRTIKE